MESWTRPGSLSLIDPSWSSAYLRRKNTFIELVPPLSESVLGFEMLRRQISDPTSPMAGSTAGKEDCTDLRDGRTACDSGAAEKPDLAAGSLCSGEGSVSALPVSVGNPSWKNLSLDENLAGCDGGCSQTLDKSLAGFSVRHRQMSKASGVTEAATEMSSSESGGQQIWSQSPTSPISPANTSQEGRSFSKSSGITEATTEVSSSDSGGQQIWSQSPTSPISPPNKSEEGRSFSKSSGITEATTDVGSAGPEDQEALQDSWALMYPTGSEPARLLKAKGLTAAVASVPLKEDGRPTSLGSFGHATGACRPCAHSSSSRGCDAGVLCRFCHFDHPGFRKLRSRPCKGKRERYRNLLGKLAAQVDEDPTSFNVIDDDKLPPSIKFDPRMKAKLSAKMSRYAQQVHSRQEAAFHVMPEPR